MPEFNFRQVLATARHNGVLTQIICKDRCLDSSIHTYTTYDVHHSKKRACAFFEETAGGPLDLSRVFVEGGDTPDDYWAADGVTLVRFDDEEVVTSGTPPTDEELAEMVEGDTIYCEACFDWLPTRSSRLCVHTWSSVRRTRSGLALPS